MATMTWYQWFKAGHVIVAVLWVGGGATLALMAIMTLRLKDPLRSPSLPTRPERSASCSTRLRRCSCSCSESA